MNSKMTEGPIGRRIFYFSLPILVGQVLQQLYNIVDSIIVGRFVGEHGLAAVGATWALSYIICYFCIGTCIGISVPLSQSYGAGKQHKLRCYYSNGIFFSAGLAILITSITTLLCKQFLIWLQTPADVLDDACIYLIIIFAGLPFTILYNFCFGVLMALGDSSKSSVFMGISTVLNLFLDLFTITVLHWGVAGAALATIFSQGMAGLCSLLYIIKKYEILRPHPGEWKVRAPYIRNILRMSMPMGLQYSITAVGAIILQYSVNTLGSTAVAGFSAGSKIKSFFVCPLNALGTALSSFAGQNFGARKMDRIRKGVRSTLAMGIVYALAVIVIIFFAGDLIAGLFVDSGESPLVIQYASQFARYISVFHLELAVLFTYRYAVQGMGYGQYSIYSGLAEMLGRSVVALLLVPLYGFTAVCWNEGITFIAGIAVIVPIYFVLMRRQK